MELTTHGMTGTGGVFEPTESTFFVDELPLYEPEGAGEHCYLRIRKCGLNTRDVVRRIVEVFGVSERDIGTAGLKDRHATTTQTISVLGLDPARAAELECDGVEVLWARLHRNKLKTGHLEGNRFRLQLQGVAPDAEQHAEAIFARLSTIGMANYFGLQRFGRHGDNALRGRKLLERGLKRAGRWKGRLLVSALQSALFNDYLHHRVAEGALVTALAGDIMRKQGSGGQFTCAEPEVDQPRVDGFEISPTGPMFGVKMKRPGEGSVPAGWEEAVLERAGLTLESFRKVKRIAEGTRRPLRVLVGEPKVERVGQDLWVTFSLPSGSYATVVIAELTQTPLPAAPLLPQTD